MKTLKDRFIDLYCFSSLKYSEIEEALNIKRNEVRILYEETKKERDEISIIKTKFTKIRQTAFKNDFSKFYKWYKKQLQECYYCGTTQEMLTGIFRKGRKILPYSSKKGFLKRSTGTLEIERLDSNLDYSEGNLVLACPLCNNAKSNLISANHYKEYFSYKMSQYLKHLYKVSENETNQVFISDKLKHKVPRFYDDFRNLLNDNNIPLKEISNTKDIWCRDYMPIQLYPNKFIFYSYNPDYLQDNYGKSIKTNSLPICRKLSFDLKMSNIILDGGNVIKSKNCVILTDKIFTENIHSYTENELIAELRHIFETNNIVIIPRDPDYKISKIKNKIVAKGEFFGHADGMVRFITENKVIVSDYSYNKKFRKKLLTILDNAKLDYEEMKFNVNNYNDNYNWAYINFLHLKDFIIVPIFEIEEDEQAIKMIGKLFPDHKILSLISNEIVEKDGGLNCITWTILR